MNTAQGPNSGLNALTFDKAGNVYVSDSFLGVIWKTGPNGGSPSIFIDSQTLSPQAATGVILVPPFGANGVEFNDEYTEMYVANTAYHSIVEVPVTLNPDGSVSVAGQAQVLTTGINAPDGIAVDRRDNLWVVANQQEEIDVINPNVVTSQGTLAKVIAKRGDFQGISEDGTVQGLLFPASPAFSLTGNTCIRRTLLCSCLLRGFRSRRSIRLGRSRSSITRSPRSALKSLH
jgi:hypothetical protein